jgi:broad specificity phosphatase PhoE
MEVVFIRHGHATHNEAFLLEGESAYFSEKHLNAPLTPLGHTQTKALSIPCVERVFVSPLYRCIQTARNVFDEYQVLHLHDGLLETQGRHPVNRRQQKEELYMYAPVHLDSVSDSYVFNVETPEDVKERAAKTMKDILERSVGCKRIAIVTHHDWLFGYFGESFAKAGMKVVTY